MKTRNLFWLSAALLMAACTNEEDISMASSSAIQFNAAISESRVIGNTWEPGDEVGISMSAGGSMTNNVLYTAKDASGTFQTNGTALRFPDESPSDVTFYAYYPYSNTLADNKTLTFEVDGKTDVLWASETVSVDKQASNTVQLGFSHALSKVILQAEDFPEDIEVTLSEGYSQATLDITTGTVTGSTAETDYSVNLVKEGDAVDGVTSYSAIVLPCTSATKTLTIASATEGKQWTYTISSATYEDGQQYAYKASYRDAAGVQFTENGINGWGGDTANPEDLGEGTESERPKKIAECLNGKTYLLNIDYYYDQVNLEGKNGYTYDSGNGFGDNVENNWKWNADLKVKCENSSITFHYEGGELTADAVDNGTERKGITVTVNNTDKTLTFSEAPFTFHGYFTDNWVGGYVENGSNPEPGKEGTVWYLLAQTPGTEAGSFILGSNVTNVEDLFTTGMHWAYHLQWTDSAGYRVLNFVEKTQDGE